MLGCGKNAKLNQPKAPAMTRTPLEPKLQRFDLPNGCYWEGYANTGGYVHDNKHNSMFYLQMDAALELSAAITPVQSAATDGLRGAVECENCGEPSQQPYHYCKSCRSGGIGIDDDTRAELAQAEAQTAQLQERVAKLTDVLKGIHKNPKGVSAAVWYEVGAALATTGEA